MTDTPTGIAWPLKPDRYPHVVAGIHIGPMSASLPAGKFGAVLSVGEKAGTVPDAVAHRHLPLSYSDMNLADLQQGVDWVLSQVRGQRIVLIRSERGRQRPGLIAALAILGLGGRRFDALTCVHRADPEALSDFRYLAIVTRVEQDIRSQEEQRQAGRGQ